MFFCLVLFLQHCVGKATLLFYRYKKWLFNLQKYFINKPDKLVVSQNRLLGASVFNFYLSDYQLSAAEHCHSKHT